ncbi:MAG TPA: MFS transporter [Chitinophagaceae bacterium]|nr:MFS transporter [Chitinophagaceae bacterium]
MSEPRRPLVLLLAFGHGLNDCIAGFFLGRLVQIESSIVQAGLGLFMYNVLAFGGQYPVALWLEKLGKPRQVLLLAYALNAAAIGLFFFTPQLPVLLAGIASALYHVAGGSVCAKENRSTNIGVFAAPGVAGLIFGGYAAHAGLDLLPWLLGTAMLMLFMLNRFRFPIGGVSDDNNPRAFHLDRHDLVMILLLTVIALRSVIWNLFQLIHDREYEWLLAIAGAAFAGKIIGGWVADRIGWKLYVYLSLATATPLLTFFRKDLVLFCIGIALLQSGIPATTSLLIQSTKGKTERAVALSFGTAIILGAVIFYTPYREHLFGEVAVVGIALSMTLLFLLATGRLRRST